MKFRLLSTLLLLTPFAMSDEIQMLDGKVYKNCSIEQESATSISFMVNISKGIKDAVTVQKDKVKLVIRSTPDEKAFAKLAETYGTPSSSDNKLTWANEGIKACEGLLAKYPKTKLKPDVDKLTEGLKAIAKEEMDRLAKEEAERKAAEPTPEELMKGRYDIEANKLLEAMKSKAKQANAVGAMQAYDSLNKNYKFSQAFVEGTDLAEKLLPQLNTNLDKMIVAAKAKDEEENKKQEQERKEERKLLSKMTEEQKAEVKARNEARREAQKAKREQYREFQNKLREKKMRWFNPDAGFVDSLEDLKKVVEDDLRDVKQELADRKAGQTESGKATPAFKKAWELVDAGKFEEAREEVSIIRSCRVKPEYWNELQTKITDGIAAAKEAERVKRQEEYAKRIADRKKTQELRRQKYSIKDLGDKKEDKKADSGKPNDQSKVAETK